MIDEEWFNEIKKEYGSLENFVKERTDGGAELVFFGYNPFSYLYSNKLLLENDIVRTNLQSGVRDAHYKITREGKLEGIEAARGLYSGDAGIHDPEKILGLEEADNGWSIDFFAKSRICIFNFK
jgi:hypothetical protein